MSMYEGEKGNTLPLGILLLRELEFVNPGRVVELTGQCDGRIGVNHLEEIFQYPVTRMIYCRGGETNLGGGWWTYLDQLQIAYPIEPKHPTVVIHCC
jgi:hypothetical protein